MRPDGTAFRTILRFKADSSDNCTVDQATWSPNGRTVLYSTWRGIWTLRADGKRKRSVLDVGSSAAWPRTGAKSCSFSASKRARQTRSFA
jgi:hypothetical protein